MASRPQVFRSCAAINSSWDKKKRAMGWTNSATSQALRDAKKFEVCCAFFPGRWSEYRSYENTSLVFNEAWGLFCQGGLTVKCVRGGRERGARRGGARISELELSERAKQ